MIDSPFSLIDFFRMVARQTKVDRMDKFGFRRLDKNAAIPLISWSDNWKKNLDIPNRHYLPVVAPCNLATGAISSPNSIKAS
ncbi:hypothetical protein ACRCJZ_00285 [Aerococcus urinaeequi]|uniref:hypothetical protein n=1 Tax=Aerococcus urinaeequi TaxID=51665 RepID=UPI003D6B262D